jgi:hypothetical protein
VVREPNAPVRTQGVANGVIAERVGWKRGITLVRDCVTQLRPLRVPPNPTHRPCELAHLDLWQPTASPENALPKSYRARYCTCKGSQPPPDGCMCPTSTFAVPPAGLEPAACRLGDRDRASTASTGVR